MSNLSQIKGKGESLVDLRKRYAGHVQRMNDLVARGRQMTPGDRQEFNELKNITDACYNSIRAKENFESGQGADVSTRGAENEILGAKQSVSGWLRAKGAADGTDRDQNRFWGERCGFARETVETRALGEDTAGSGQAIVPQEWTANFVDVLLPATVAGKLGVSKFVMNQEIVNVPVYTATVAPTWLAENAATSLDTNPAFAPLQFNAQGSFYDVTLYSTELAQDAYINGGLAGMLTGELARKYAIVLDQAMLFGVADNTGNPGLLWESGVVSTPITGDTGSGAYPTNYNDVSLAAQRCRVALQEPNAVLTNPQVYGYYSRLNASTYAKYWTPPQDVVNLWPPVVSTTMPAVEKDAPATSDDESGGTFSSLLVGNFANVLVGVRLDMTVRVLTERYIDQKQLGLYSAMRFSVRTAHPETFQRVTGIKTA